MHKIETYILLNGPPKIFGPGIENFFLSFNNKKQDAVKWLLNSYLQIFL